MTQRAVTPTIRVADWDSSFFGLRVGRLAPDADEHTDLDAVERLDRSGHDCVWIDLDVGAAHMLGRWSALGARVVDVRIELATALPDAAPPPAPGVELVTHWSDRDREAVTDLAIEQSAWSRLARDPAFAPGVGEMYRHWVGKAFAGEDEAFVWRDGGRIVGMLTAKRSADASWLELLDVDRAHRGRGIGAALVREFLRKSSADGSREARVRTQLRNMPAIRTYERAGFGLAQASFVLHWWSDELRRDALDQFPQRA